MPTLADAIQRLTAQGERRNPQSELQQLWAKYKPEVINYVNELNTKAGEHNRMLAESVRERQRGQGMGPATAQVLEDLAAGYNPSMLGVIKPKGGNWLAGSVEEAIKPLKTPLRRPDRVGSQAVTDEMWGEFLKDSPDAALNNWLETKLARYIRNEMATPEDPIRALAERGVLHVDPEQLNFRPEMHGKYMSPGQTAMAQSPTAKAWEGVSDLAVEPFEAGNLMAVSNMNMRLSGKDPLEANPWLAKVPPETPVYGIGEPRALPNDLGFSHLADELRNAVNPESGLPADLLWKYSDLPKVTVPQAVERVAKINEWRAAQKIAADQARANNAATVLHKEYPEKGFKWVELKAGDKMNPAYEVKRVQGKNGEYWDVRKPGAPHGHTTFTEEEALRASNREALQDALKYEGDTMGHCVGGYCPDVLEGRSRIFSLRSAKGEPHVTVEVRPGEDNSRFRERIIAGLLGEGKTPEEAEKAAYQLYKDTPGSIVQIKGKQNRAPNPEYLPYVQDFVRSQPWSDVGDLANAGLMSVRDWAKVGGADPEVAKQIQNKLGDYATMDDLLSEFEKIKPLPEGFAQGGIVESGNMNYNPERIDALVAQLKEELYAD